MGDTAAGTRICLKGGRAEIIEKRSRFIAEAAPVKSEEEAAAFIERVRKENRDARHNCYAYVTGPDGQTEKCSDDGEPSRTAGLPILNQIRGRNLKDVCVVVTRYFGGILLGTGGLSRAYGSAAAAGLDASVTAEQRQGVRLSVSLDYELYGKVRYLAEQEGWHTAGETFGADVSVTLLIPAEEAEGAEKKITELCAGRNRVTEKTETFYCTDGTNVIY